MHPLRSDASIKRKAPPFAAVGAALLAFAAAIAGQAPATLVPLNHDVPRLSSEINIDGSLDEAAWESALALELNYEVQPGENVPPPVRTVCMVAYDDRFVYFGFKAYDPDPSQIRARFSDRDQAWNDDWVGVVLDTFNDQRRAYEMLSNPLGVQIDAVNDDVGGNYDASWNAIWKSRGRITESGYEVEMAIPFNQIRFQSAGGEQTWGFDAIRSYPRGDRHHIGLFPRDRGNNSYLSQTQKITGMSDASAGSNLEIVPTLTATSSGSREVYPDGEFVPENPIPEIGVSVRWGITPNISLNGALNPEFSTVEADILRLNINQQFALYFPETRPFFLEGADYFNTPLDLVYTRSVTAPIGAAKLTGKQGSNTTGFFAAVDDFTTMLYPGAEMSASQKFEDLKTSAAVARYRRDFGRSSTVGATVTDRRGEDGEYFNTVISADSILRPSSADEIVMSVAASRSQYAPVMIERQVEAGLREDEIFTDTFDDHAFRLVYMHQERGWWTRASYSDTGAGFRSDLGWRPQVNYRGWVAGAAKIWWSDGEKFYNRMAWGGDVDQTVTQSGELLEEEIETWWNVNGPRESRADVNLGSRNKTFEGVSYDDMPYANLYFGIRPGSKLYVEAEFSTGDWIDFANNQPAKQLEFRPAFRLNLGRHLMLRYFHTYSQLDRSEGRLFRVHAPELRVVYQFNVRAFIRAVVQYTDVLRDPSLYSFEIPERSKNLFGQFLFAYKINPQTAFYLGYDDEYVGTDQFQPVEVGRTVFVKVGYAWVP